MQLAVWASIEPSSVATAATSAAAAKIVAAGVARQLIGYMLFK
jgi:hypothetical protein